MSPGPPPDDQPSARLPRGLKQRPALGAAAQRGANNMPKFKPADPEARREFRAGLLTPDARSAFDDLADWVDAPTDRLDWRYDLGVLIGRLRAADAGSGHGTGWFDK